MERTLQEIKSRIEELETLSKSLLQRINDLFDTSACLGGLCSCMAVCSGTETQMKEVICQVAALEKKVREKDAKDIKRDRKIDILSQDMMTYMRDRQDVLQAQIDTPSKQLHKMRSTSAKSPYAVLDAPGHEYEQTSSERRAKQISKSLGKGESKHTKQTFNKKHLRPYCESQFRETDDGTTDSDDSEAKEDFESLSTEHGISEDSDEITRDIETHSGKHKMQSSSLKPQQHHHHHHQQQQQQQQQQKSMPSKDKAHTNVYQDDIQRQVSVRGDSPLRTNNEVSSGKERAFPNKPEQEPSLSLVPFQTKIGQSVPEIVEQTKKEYYLTADVWEVEAKAEEVSAQKSPLHYLEAVTTILLVDTSHSMAEGGAWKQVATFVNDYISGLEQLAPSVNHLENLALVTFGAQTRCHQRYTNDFSLIRRAFENLQLGGPSPLFGGLMMAHAVAQTCRKDLILLKNGMYINTKIILITDGEPTEICLHRGPDIPEQDQMDETKAALLTMMEALGRERQTLDIFCVPVGNANMEFLHMMFGKEGGRRILNYKDGHYFSRRLFLSTKLEPRTNLLGGRIFVIPRLGPDITGTDFAHMQEILDDDRNKTNEAILRRERNPYEERTTRNERLLPIGARVRRGPDWDQGDQDSGGPGTVVGHNLYLDMLWVHWDETDEIRQYHYGNLGRYYVLPVEEPRMPLPGQPLEVGCVVCPGKDWKSDVATQANRGVIYSILNEKGTRKAAVRWDNGKRGIYSYGDDRLNEIQICLTDLSVPTMTNAQRVGLPAVQSSSQKLAIEGAKWEPASTVKATTSTELASIQKTAPKKTNKNKNKNR